MGAGAQADRAPLDRAPLVFAQAAPYPGVLAAIDGPAQALVHDRAPAAYLLCFIYLEQGRTAIPDREKQLGVHLTAGGFVTPVHDATPSGPPAASGCGRRARLYLACEAFHELIRIASRF